MNETKAGQLWPIMKAFSEGAHVEMFMPDHSPSGLRLGVWVKVQDPTFDPKWKWRVAETKFQPAKPISSQSDIQTQPPSPNPVAGQPPGPTIGSTLQSPKPLDPQAPLSVIPAETSSQMGQVSGGLERNGVTTSSALNCSGCPENTLSGG